jgi:hypothetical protein
MGSRVLVCGGRHYDDKTRLWKSLDDLREKRGPFDCLIHGDASGADKLAKGWAESRRVLYASFPAKWVKYGVAAGAIRNQQMINEGKPDFVVAFPGGKGTRDMVRRAKAFGLEVIEIPTELDVDDA